MSRWIRVQTSIFDHELFAAAELSQREAWLWLLANVAWKETRHRIGNEVVSVPVGSIFTTLRALQAAWRWKSDKRVRSFISMLEAEGMISANSDAGKTQISVCNYARYQDVGRSEDASGTHGGRSEDAQKTPLHQSTNTSSLRSEDIAQPALDKSTPRSELSAVLDSSHADAVIEHRKRIRKPLTAHAAKLLAGKFGRWSDPNAAADAMVSNGWQGFEPEWMHRSGSGPRGNSQAPPRETEHARHQRESREAIEARLNRTKPHDEFASDGPAFDLEPRDFRAH